MLEKYLSSVMASKEAEAKQQIQQEMIKTKGHLQRAVLKANQCVKGMENEQQRQHNQNLLNTFKIKISSANESDKNYLQQASFALKESDDISIGLDLLSYLDMFQE